jgi:hypothetical protein
VRGKNPAAYRLITSPEDLLLLAQHEVHAELYTRQPNRRWLLEDFTALTDRVPLASVGCTLTLAEVYDKVDLGGVRSGSGVCHRIPGWPADPEARG